MDGLARIARQGNGGGDAAGEVGDDGDAGAVAAGARRRAPSPAKSQEGRHRKVEPMHLEPVPRCLLVVDRYARLPRVERARRNPRHGGQDELGRRGFHGCIDAAAALGILERQGVGRVRHLDISVLWLQEQQLCRSSG